MNSNRFRIILPFILGLLCDALHAQYSDDFENTSTIDRWNVFESGNPVYYENLMFNDSIVEGNFLPGAQGKLVIVSGATYWYADVTGPYVYQMTWGDFTATTSVRSLNRDDISNPPEREYNSTGLILRNPDVSSGQNYIMTNLGFQSNVIVSPGCEQEIAARRLLTPTSFPFLTILQSPPMK